MCYECSRGEINLPVSGVPGSVQVELPTAAPQRPGRKGSSASFCCRRWSNVGRFRVYSFRSRIAKTHWVMESSHILTLQNTLGYRIITNTYTAKHIELWNYYRYWHCKTHWVMESFQRLTLQNTSSYGIITDTDIAKHIELCNHHRYWHCTTLLWNHHRCWHCKTHWVIESSQMLTLQNI